MDKEQSFVASFAFSISTDVTTSTGGPQTFKKIVLEALSFSEAFFLKKDDFELKLTLLYFSYSIFARKQQYRHIRSELCF